LNLLFTKTENQPIVAAFKPFGKEAGLFTINLSNADAAAKGKQVKLSPEEEKIALKHEISKDVSRVCLSTKSYAMTYGKTTLAGAMNAQESEIFKKKDEDIQPFFEAEYDLIKPLFDDPDYADYEVTAAVMDGIGEKVASFHGMIGQSGVNQSDYTGANTEVDEWLDAIDTNVEHFELLLPNLAVKYPQFAEAYHSNARIGEDVRHSGIEGLIHKKGTDEPVAGATVSLENTDKTAASDLTGAYRLVEVTAGWYYVVVTMAGNVVVRVLHKVEQGKVAKMDFEI
jgi:hypothetical protein